MSQMEYKDKSYKYYSNPRPEMQALCPTGVSKILDIGCGSGAMLKELKTKYGVEAWGVEFMEERAAIAKEHLDSVICKTAENCIDDLPDAFFDVIYFNDVLEHLANPNQLLLQIKKKLVPGGKIISSIPNARFHKVFGQYVFKKDWKYQKAGIMDFTHLRFFTSKSIKRMFAEAGYEVVQHKGINKTRSVMPYFYNILLFFTAGDMFYPQYATISVKR